jgi:hypothetical protein
LNDLGYLVIWKAAPLHVVPGFIAETSLVLWKGWGKLIISVFSLIDNVHFEK